MEDNTKIANLLLEKFVNEEIMTKSEFQMSLDKMMDRHEAKITANINAKFQTKEDFQLSIDRIMDRHEASIDAKFQIFDNKLQDIRSDMKNMETRVDNRFQTLETHLAQQFLKIDGRFNWIIGLVITSVIGITGMGLKIMSMIPH